MSKKSRSDLKEIVTTKRTLKSCYSSLATKKNAKLNLIPDSGDSYSMMVDLTEEIDKLEEEIQSLEVTLPIEELESLHKDLQELGLR